MGIKDITTQALTRLFRLGSGIKKDTAAFISFGGQSYSDNPRAISEALHKMDPDVRILWILSAEQQKKSAVPDYVQLVDKNNSFAFLRALSTSAVVVDNSRLPLIPKDRRQFFIQTWHGDRAFKKILYDSTFSEHRIATPESIEGYCDLAIAGSTYGEHQYRSAFRYKGRILMEGTPRDDCLVNPDPDRIAKIRASIGLGRKEKILLYAPTLRREFAKNGQKQVIQEIDLPAILKALGTATKEKWVCAVRAHPAMKGLTGFDTDSGILDLSEYEDMTDLLLVADMLITDYSSCAGDFALTGRPLLLYQPDIEAYLEKDRTFYFEMSDSPYWIAETQQQVEEIIQNMTAESARQNCRDILDFYGNHETGHAAESVAKEILEWIERKTGRN